MKRRDKWNPAAAVQDLESSLPIKLLQARELVMHRFRDHLREHGLTEQQWRVLRVLVERGPLEMMELSERSFLLPPSLSRTVPMLEEKGLVDREVVGNDRRRTRVSLTSQGRRLFGKVSSGSEAIYAAIGQQVGQRILDELFHALDAFILKFSPREWPLEAHKGARR